MNCLIFLSVFSLYLFSCYPTISPFRDSGDLTVSSFTLGIAHPPGYPVYVLLGKIWNIFLPFGNTGYKMNLFSCLWTGISLVIIYNILVLLFRKIFNFNNYINKILSFLFIIYLGTTPSIWQLSVVSEMYTLNLFFFSLLFLCFLIFWIRSDERYFYLFCFLYGFGLGNHHTLILLLPGFLILFLSEIWKFKNKHKIIFLSIIFFIFGFSIYIFLPLRANCNPLINWGNPTNFTRFIDVILRKGYGGIALYESGELNRNINIFFIQLLNFFKLTFTRLNFVLFLFSLFGVFFLYKKNKNLCLCFVLFYIFSGPLFFILSCLKLDEFGKAILKVYYLLPDTLIIMLSIIGLIYVLNLINNKTINVFAVILILLLCLKTLFNNYEKYNYRFSFIAYDYGMNTLRSAEKKSIILARSDTLFFVLKYLQIVDRKYQDIHSMSFWFNDWYLQQERKRNPEIEFPDNFVDADIEIVKKNFTRIPVYANYTVNIKDVKPVYSGILFGYLKDYSLEKKFDKYYQVKNLYILRNISKNFKINQDYYHYEIIHSYAVGYHNLGVFLESTKDFDKSLGEFLISIYLDCKFIEPLYEICLINYFFKKDYNKVIKFANRIIQIDPENFKGWNILGSAYGSMRDYKTALEYFKMALSIEPTYKEARQNYELLKKFVNETN